MSEEIVDSSQPESTRPATVDEACTYFLKRHFRLWARDEFRLRACHRIERRSWWDGAYMLCDKEAF